MGDHGNAGVHVDLQARRSVEGGAPERALEPEPEPEPAGLPETRASTVRLRRYTQNEVGEGQQLGIKLVHVAAPDDGRFSRTKKQCDLWEYVWAASQMLADLLLTVEARGGEKAPLRKLRTLELGCGAGLCSIVAALGGATVVATDGVADATELVAKSAALNGVSDRIETRPLDWFKLDIVPHEAFDLVIVSDCLIFRGTAKPVAAAISRALRPSGIALISDPYRRPFEEFGDALDAQGLNVELRPFKESRIASLPVNKEVAEQPGFVQHWGKQKGQLFFVHKPTQASSFNSAPRTGGSQRSDVGEGVSGVVVGAGGAQVQTPAMTEPSVGPHVCFRSIDELVELRSVVASAVDECCEPDVWHDRSYH